TSSNVNVVAGQTVANLVMVPVGDDGTVTLYSSGGTHLLADVTGWFGDASQAPGDDGLFVPIEPTRLLDSRELDAKPGPGDAIRLEVLDGIGAVVGNLTA